MEKDIRKVVVLGANGAMGSGSGEVFAAAGIETVFLARDRDKAQAGVERAETLAKSEHVSKNIRIGTYADDLAREVADADLVFEGVAERMALKREYFGPVDEHRKKDGIVATVSSGLSINEMAEGRSESFRKHFLGIHFYNPPNVIVGCETIPNGDTDPALLDFIEEFLERRLGRKVVRTEDLPAFAGNRIGFKVMNEVAQLAEEHGVAFMDMLVGPHTGRAMAPLATVDLVGWDVHQAIVQNVYENVRDEAHETLRLPDSMVRLIDAGHLGNKTPDKGGFYRQVKTKEKQRVLVLDPKSGEYRPAEETQPETPAFVRRMKYLNRVGRYDQAMRLLLEAQGPDADLLRRVVLGYVSYGLNRVGEVVKEPRDVDRIMGFGFNWAPPGVLVDLMGLRNVIDALNRAKLPVPPALEKRADDSGPLFREPHVDIGRFFVG